MIAFLGFWRISVAWQKRLQEPELVSKCLRNTWECSCARRSQDEVMRPDKVMHKAAPRQFVAKLDHLKKINGKLSKMVLRQCESLSCRPTARNRETVGVLKAWHVFFMSNASWGNQPALACRTGRMQYFMRRQNHCISIRFAGVLQIWDSVLPQRTWIARRWAEVLLKFHCPHVHG